jgi:hypothetical protein
MEIREIKSTRIEIDSCTFQNCITPCAQTSDSASLMKVVASQVRRGPDEGVALERQPVMKASGLARPGGHSD